MMDAIACVRKWARCSHLRELLNRSPIQTNADKRLKIRDTEAKKKSKNNKQQQQTKNQSCNFKNID
jgi:hypothetical protein